MHNLTIDNPPQSFELSDLRTIPGLVAENPEILKESVLRWQLRHRHKTGLGQYCVAVGKNVLISKSGYERWLVQKSGDGAPHGRTVSGS